jgi:gamma-glutamyltranspeptidase/glutathione hydrolase
MRTQLYQGPTDTIDFVRRILVIILALYIACTPISPQAFGFKARHAIVVTEAEPAARAGVSVLQRGGNAIDAAAAAALAAGVVYPVSCGIGGGGFMLVYIAATGKVYALDYRERAPSAVRQTLFMRNGRLDEALLRQGPLSIAVPGEIAGLAQAVRRFGRMPFAEVAKPAIELARNGFPCSRHLAEQIARQRAALAAEPGLRELFLRSDGSPREVGERIVEPELARTLERLRSEPEQSFYHGTIARELISELRERGAILTVDDLADYKAVWRSPLHYRYGKGYEVFTMPPPSAGGGLVLEMLGVLDGLNLTPYSLGSPSYLELLARVMHQVSEDRAMYADPDFIAVPLDFLLSPQHLAQLRQNVLMKVPTPVRPSHADQGTSHLCVVDAQGNVVSLTTTINTSFGAKLMAKKLGIILNDEMDDFALGRNTLNAFGLRGHQRDSMAPGKRPLSSMAPTIVMHHGRRPLLVIGASGGPSITTGILQVALDILNFNLIPQLAVAMPRIYAQEMPKQVGLEDAIPPAVESFFIEQGYRTRRFRVLGDVTAVLIQDGWLYPGADPRKDGGVAGY